jgi:homoserine dehydrogenase
VALLRRAAVLLDRRLSDPAGAMEVLARARELAPTDMEVLEELLAVCTRTGRDRERERILARAVEDGAGGYHLSVEPVLLPPDHPFGRLGSKQMGILYETDIYGTITSIIEERTPTPSAASMLRDILDIYI